MGGKYGVPRMDPDALWAHPFRMDIVLVDDHPAVRAGLRGLVDDEDDLRVAATAATAREGFEAIADTRPQVALLDALRDGAGSALDSRALRAIGERLDEGDLPILGMLAHGVGPREIATTLGLEPEWLEARRWAMLSRLRGAARRHPLAVA